MTRTQYKCYCTLWAEKKAGCPLSSLSPRHTANLRRPSSCRTLGVSAFRSYLEMNRISKRRSHPALVPWHGVSCISPFTMEGLSHTSIRQLHRKHPYKARAPSWQMRDGLWPNTLARRRLCRRRRRASRVLILLSRSGDEIPQACCNLGRSHPKAVSARGILGG